MSYHEALGWLYGLQLFGIKLGLENIARLIAALEIDLTQRRVIHVAGTNGKGSVCAMAEAICRAAGYRTGLFTSPHLVTFRERIRLSGEMISEFEVAAGLTNIRMVVQEWSPHPTFFEIVTALALKYFGDKQADIVVLETGMGGRLDATNAVRSSVAVITPIDLDHQKWLGSTLQAIAAEKAGIIKSTAPVVSAPQDPDAAKVLEKKARECGAPLQFVSAPYSDSPVALRGRHQEQNAAVAIAAIRAARIASDRSAVTRGLATVEWPARFQYWDERTIIDGAHNPAAARVLAQTWREVFGDRRATLVLAVLADKDVARICSALAAISRFALLPNIRSQRAANPDDIAAVLHSSAPALPCSVMPSFAEALETARQRSDPILISGSLHFAGEALAHLQGRPAVFEECAQ